MSVTFMSTVLKGKKTHRFLDTSEILMAPFDFLKT